MKKLTSIVLLLASLSAAQTAVRVNIRLGVGHPLVRPGRMVVVRTAPPVVVRERIVYAAPVVWAPRVVAVPVRERLVWEDSERFARSEDWVDTTLRAGQSGNRLFLRINGRAQVDFAEVHFRNGNVQVVDFRERPLDPGTYSLLDFPDGRHVEYVRLVARARSNEAKISVLMAR
jgi:hypothetical protein